jgi:hypothetical protein
LPEEVEMDADRRVIFRVYPKPISVSYKHVFELTPRLYEQYADVKFFIHVGLHSRISGYRLEKRGRKGPYTRKDIEGESFEPTTEEGKVRWGSFPLRIYLLQLFGSYE